MYKVFLISILAGLLSGCSHFATPIFRSPGAYRPSAQSLTPPVSRGPFSLTWPVEEPKLTQKFKPHRSRPHQGIDLGGRRGVPILAAHEGYVIYAGNGFRGYGKMIIIEYDRTWATLYAHLNQLSVSEGEYLQPGQVIGSMGRTGRATGVHLHFELMQNKQPVDPLQYISSEHRLVSH